MPQPPWFQYGRYGGNDVSGGVLPSELMLTSLWVPPTDTFWFWFVVTLLATSATMGAVSW